MGNTTGNSNQAQASCWADDSGSDVVVVESAPDGPAQVQEVPPIEVDRALPTAEVTEKVETRPKPRRRTRHKTAPPDLDTVPPAVKELNSVQSATLFNSLLPRNEAEHEGHDGHGHGHGPAEPSIITAFAAAVINYLLMFGLCCAYGMIMFGDKFNAQHRGLAVKMNLGTALFVGLLLAIFSKLPVSTGGPDLNPVVLLGDMVVKIADAIAENNNLEYPQERRLLSMEGRGLAGSSDVEFCMGYHLKNHKDDCKAYHESLIATTIFTVAVSSAILGLVFFLLGHYKLTKYVSYVPTSIMEAFMGCVGYKVFAYALKFCNYELRQFLPAACVGVPLYFMKAYHLGNPAIVMPLGLLVPLGVFHIILLIVGWDVPKAREDGLFFDEIEHVNFWEVYTQSIGHADAIDFSAWAKTLPDLAVMVIVVVMDCLLKVAGTENKLPVKCDKDYEVKTYGLLNVLTTLTGSTVGYMQLKFNVIAYGVLNNVVDRRYGVLYALLCGACYFGTYLHFNILPRFFLGALLFFAGAGFVAENLWGSRKYLSMKEWIEILIIVGVFILSGQLLIAVIVGGLLTGLSFLFKYSSVPAIAGNPMSGVDFMSSERHHQLVLSTITHISSYWTVVLRLKGYLFFASAQKLSEFVRDYIDKQVAQNLPKYLNVQYIVFDCEMLDGIDASAAKALAKITKDMWEQKVRCIWCSSDPTFKKRLNAFHIIQLGGQQFESIDGFLRALDHRMQLYIQEKQESWLSLHPAFALHHKANLTSNAMDPLEGIFRADIARFGCPWQYLGVRVLEASSTVLWSADEPASVLYLVHTGAVGLFKAIPKDGEPWPEPVAVYRHGWFMNQEFFLSQPSRHYAVALEDGICLYWTQEKWHAMQRANAAMMSEIQRAAEYQALEDARNRVFFERKQLANMHKIHDDSEHLALEATGNHYQFLPEEMIIVRTRLETAKALGKLGFFDEQDAEDGVFPPMPPALLIELRITFDTFAVEENGEKALRIEEVPHALGYIGLFLELWEPPADMHFISEEDFIVLAHTAAMAPLGKAMVAKIEELFAAGDADNSGELERDELVTIFRNFLTPHIGAEELDGVVSVWAQGANVVGQGAEKLVANISVGDSCWARKDAESEWCDATIESVGEDDTIVVRWDTPQDGQQTATVTKRNMKKVWVRKDYGLNDACRAIHPKSGIWETGRVTAINDDGTFEVTWEHHPGSDQIKCEKMRKILNLSVIDLPTFTAMMSRYIRKHHRYWIVLEAVEKMLGQPFKFSEREVVTLDNLQKFAPQKSKEELEEMMWCFNWLRLDAEGPGTIDLNCLLTAFLTIHPHCPKELLPAPKLQSLRMKQRLPTLATATRAGAQRLGVQSITTRSVENTFKANMRATQSLHKESTKDFASSKMASQTSLVNFLEGSQEVLEDPDDTWKQKLYLFLEEPKSSKKAWVLSIFMMVMICLSVLTLVLEPLISGKSDDQSDGEKEVWAAIELVFAGIFTLELLLRFISCDAFGTQTMTDFVATPMNICDFVSILPTYLFLIAHAHPQHLRLLRVARLAKLGRLARVGRLGSKLGAPMAVVMFVVWGIYLKHEY